MWLGQMIAEMLVIDGLETFEGKGRASTVTQQHDSDAPLRFFDLFYLTISISFRRQVLSYQPLARDGLSPVKLTYQRGG